jgi:5-methylcytosine-specific restriction endonuclease McrA
VYNLIYGDDTPRRTSIPKAVKVQVWNIYIGADKAEGKCYVCGRTIHVTDFDLGHNQAVAKGGKNNISNLRPICRTCNTSMGTQAIESFKKKYFNPIGTEEKPSSTKRTAAKKKTTATKRKTTSRTTIVRKRTSITIATKRPTIRAAKAKPKSRTKVSKK